MRLWRISNHASLEGIGGLMASGRWHGKGRRILYSAEHPALALLEMLVHFDFPEMPKTYQLLEIEAPDDSLEPVAMSALVEGWAGLDTITRDIGDGWLGEQRSLLLRVPSVITPESWNVLINPLHPRAEEVAIKAIRRVPLDPRLG